MSVIPAVKSDAPAVARRLHSMGQKLSDLREVDKAAATIIATAALPLTPRRTGNLARSVTVVQDGSAWAVEAKARYALVVYFGWPAGHMPARPWLAIAAQRTEDAWLAKYTEAVHEILTED